MPTIRHLPAALCGLAALIAAAPAAAQPQSIPYSDRVQTANNSAGVIYHPYGDYFEVWNNGPGDYGVSGVYRYAGATTWHSAVEEDPPGPHWDHHDVLEHRHIVFYIVGPDNQIS